MNFPIRDYDRDGFVIFRRLIQREDAEAYAQHYLDYKDKNPRALAWNSVHDTDLPQFCKSMPVRWEFKHAASFVMGKAPNLYSFRFVVKDAQNADKPVFLHQDSAYHCGGMNKASLFVALTEVNEERGGLAFFPGTHKFGHLGDAGEIKFDKVPADCKPVIPEMMPGDAVLMSSHVWHCSGPNTTGRPRIIADIIYQPHKDTSYAGMYDDWFVRSRVSRIRELEAEKGELFRE